MLRSRTSRAVPALVAGLIAAGAFAATAAAQAPVPCSSIGGGKYNCQFYPAGDGISGGTPVLNSAGERVGYLNEGTNWIICQQAGRTERSGAYYNKWWAYTQANNQQWGWASAVFGKGGDNDGQFGGGVPNCNGSKGNPPGAGGGAPPPPPPGQQPSDSLVDAVFIIIRHESNGNPDAINNWDSNAKRGQPSQGLMQVIPATFSWRRSPNLPNSLRDPAANIYAGLNWGIYKYGSIANIPGVKSVRSGGKYKPYAGAQMRGVTRATTCGKARAGRLTLAVNGYGQKCSRARKAAAALDRQPAIRNATAPVFDLIVKAGSVEYTCAVDPSRRGRALRAVSCQSGKKTLWWAASRRR
jgi:hypothetical protein